jgi:type I restriction enzyme R subunit
MTTYNIITSTNESTVVAEYVPEYRTAAEYQSEADLEREFIDMLSMQGYEKLINHNETALVPNLRRQLEILNNFAFSDNEWTQFFGKCIATANEGIIEKTRKIQDDHVQILRCDNGSTKNICLIDKKNIHNNTYRLLTNIKNQTGHMKLAMM